MGQFMGQHAGCVRAGLFPLRHQQHRAGKTGHQRAVHRAGQHPHMAAHRLAGQRCVQGGLPTVRRGQAAPQGVTQPDPVTQPLPGKAARRPGRPDQRQRVQRGGQDRGGAGLPGDALPAGDGRFPRRSGAGPGFAAGKPAALGRGMPPAARRAGSAAPARGPRRAAQGAAAAPAEWPAPAGPAQPGRTVPPPQNTGQRRQGQPCRPQQHPLHQIGQKQSAHTGRLLTFDKCRMLSNYILQLSKEEVNTFPGKGALGICRHRNKRQNQKSEAHEEPTWFARACFFYGIPRAGVFRPDFRGSGSAKRPRHSGFAKQPKPRWGFGPEKRSTKWNGRMIVASVVLVGPWTGSAVGEAGRAHRCCAPQRGGIWYIPQISLTAGPATVPG